ncbi:cell division protein FtsZ [Sphingomonas sp. So64.6b]|uniref:cell division protein FtsZ n=1 Tax=Sphingomonas sp. So64.6b TaxID=2997354 RepID=UPI0015FEC33A|nr:cell division protein FtsZ [Sphingomonas sp. So64.6b]QNA85349.1 cell division protein FtsZ [Sphingomonas sp. So64.6b]
MVENQAELWDTSGVTVFGVGGAGGNAVAQLIGRHGRSMKILCANTDIQALRAVPAASRLQLGRKLTGGLGAGTRAEIGRAAAEEAMPDIVRALKGSSLCFVAAGLGGGTGTGAAPIIARAARDRGILTIGVATMPFAFEGKRRMRAAEMGAIDLHDSVDAMITVCNQNLLGVAGREATLRAALGLSDSIIRDSATGFALLLGEPALKRVTPADLRAILSSSGHAIVGYSEHCTGAGRAAEAAKSALNNPLLEGAPATAQRLLITVAGGSDLGLFEVDEVIALIRAGAACDVELAWGAVIDPALAGRLRVGIVAAGLPVARPIGESAAAYILVPRATIQETVYAVAANDVSAALAVPQAQDADLPPAAAASMVSFVASAAAANAKRIFVEPGSKPRTAFGGPLPKLTHDPIAMSGNASKEIAGAGIARRARSLSLADRIHDATRDLKRRLGRRLKATSDHAAAPTSRLFHVTKAFASSRHQGQNP